MVVYKKGHKNSQGEDAPWTIVSHDTGKILSSHKSKNAADEHLKQMEYYKHKDAQTEGVKDFALAGALAVSPMASGAVQQEFVDAPVVKDYSTVQFDKNVTYKLTPDQYRKLSACKNLPTNYVVPRTVNSELAAKQSSSSSAGQSGTESSKCGTMCQLGNAVGSGVKSAWNGIKDFGKGLYNGWNSKQEAVDEFNRWLAEQPRTPMMEAVQQIYDVLFETENNVKCH